MVWDWERMVKSGEEVGREGGSGKQMGQRKEWRERERREISSRVFADLCIELVKIGACDGEGMFHGDALCVVEHSRQFVAFCCLQDRQLVVRLA